MNMMEWMMGGGIVSQHYGWPRPGGGIELAFVVERDGRRARIMIPVHREALEHGGCAMVRSCGPIGFVRLDDWKCGDEWLRFSDPVQPAGRT